MSMLETARIEGYAAVYGAPDMSGDVILPGAFGVAGRADGVRMLHQHEAAEPIGVWENFREDAFGLYAEGRLILSAPRAREVWTLLRGGALDGLSVGFRTVRAGRENGRRLIIEASLWEVSVVTFPMAAGARIRAVGAPESEEAPAGSPPTAAGWGLFAETLRQAAAVVRPTRASV